MSHDPKHKVGCIIVKDDSIIAEGWNGTPRGCDNACRDACGVTRPEVVHAEANAIAKLARNGGGAYGATAYVTLSPCWECAKLLKQAGIQRVVYRRLHKKVSDAAEWLSNNGVKVESVWKD